VLSLPEKTCHTKISLPEQIRVSLGTAIVLGLLKGKLDAQPTTAYLMTYRTGKCSANCGFCPQARESKSNTELLSRVTWPTFPTPNVITALSEKANQGKIKRICIQALNYPDVFVHLEAVVKEIKNGSAVPVSVSCQPLDKENIQRLAKAGAGRLGIALDAATETVFEKVKGSAAGGAYSWENQFRQLNEALIVFGRGNVSTHVIVGLGETEKEAAKVIQRCVDLGVLPALFAFTPVRGTALEAKSPPDVGAYRRVQLARYLIVTAKSRFEKMLFDVEGKISGFGVAGEMLDTVIAGGLPFRTSGCPDCNRPFYNEKPSGPFYNYPQNPNREEIEKIRKQLS
jgi:biotin synthase-related radical SAM superfamily protein